MMAELLICNVFTLNPAVKRGDMGAQKVLL